MCSGDGISDESIRPLLESLVEEGALVRTTEVGRKRYALTEPGEEESKRIFNDSGMSEALCRRHFEWCANLAMWAGPELFSSERGNWLDLLKLELSNLTSALKWSLANAPEDGLILAGALRPLWNELGFELKTEGRDLFTALIRSPEIPNEAKKSALQSAPRSAQMANNLEEAAVYLRDNLEIARDVGDGALLSLALLGVADATAIEGDNSGALRLTEEARAHADAVGDSRTAAEAMMRIGNYLRARGDYASASEMFEKSLGLFRKLNEDEKAEAVLRALGSLKVLQGDYSGAISLLERREK